MSSTSQGTTPSTSVDRAVDAPRYTSGPWLVAATDDTLVVKGRLKIAETFAIGLDEEHEYANARLIAAAPDLLEALAEVRVWISNWDPNFTQDDEWPVAQAQIDAAIAKATGAA